MKKSKPMQVLSSESLNDLAHGETTYFQDCEDLNLLQSNNYREISENHVIALMESIQETGIQAEVALVASIDQEGQITITIEDGHHRLEAVRRLRQEAERSGRHWLYRPLPCRIRVSAPDGVKGAFAIASVMRNQLRKEESLWDKLAAFERLREAGEKAVGISKLVGLDERSVRRILSLKRIPPVVRNFAKQNEATVKAATLYKLAAAIEKIAGDAPENMTQLLAEAKKESPDRVALAEEMAQTFLSEAGEDQSGESSLPLLKTMITFLALDKTPKIKGTLWTRACALSGDGVGDANHMAADENETKSLETKSRSGASQTLRSLIPQGWVALDPQHLETLMCDAGIPEEWRTVVSNLIASQNN